MDPHWLSRELRHDRSAELRRRRQITGLSLVGAAAGAIVGAYQMGLFRRLPDLPLRLFDASRVDASDYAYKRLDTPDGLLMIANYAVTAILAGAGGRDRWRDQPWLPVALAAKTVYDTVTALRLGVEEWQDNEALCGYCQAATLASLASMAIAMPEAARALRAWRNRGEEGGWTLHGDYSYEDGYGLDEPSANAADAFYRAYPEDPPRHRRLRYRAYA